MTTPEELDALPVELSVAQTKIIDLRARVAELERYGDPTFYTNRLHIAESSLGKAAEYAAELRQKLQSANGRANAAEARASSEQKKREAAEAELARRAHVEKALKYAAGCAQQEATNCDEVGDRNGMRACERIANYLLTDSTADDVLREMGGRG
ncbi:hypothetical protein [Neotabrizicola sp. sgz301269]|uniref:hypothetical protein n=1 Tax=Neotabrizicola sp. sgz301269 TaxID=3276282 RepID=UPI00376F7AE7